MAELKIREGVTTYFGGKNIVKSLKGQILEKGNPFRDYFPHKPWAHRPVYEIPGDARFVEVDGTDAVVSVGVWRDADPFNAESTASPSLSEITENSDSE
ncbi:MAG: hypothetical protein ABIJ20_00800 [Nanoarchaeota archaeon]|nr:hypothetical protein [Nanoarchaeota archaeon]MBU1445189.1 hypothetical protein [Nanoarchaeota archaeon]MBU2406928.1 hypothetical protein [Nanoarchaeota archaeon]MBU2420860.1 hypothetical protein [Nanoarchaeota archaeon]MBU2475331.1 hypothetical protein [Nanoarchaeota archaeon]